MSTPEREKKLEDRSVAKIEALGGQALKLVVLGQRGFLDRTCLIFGGHTFFCEFKRDRLGRISQQQIYWGKMLTALGFNVYFPDTDEEFDHALATEIRLGQRAEPVDRPALREHQRPRATTRRRG